MARMVPFPMLPTESSAERRLYEGFLEQLPDEYVVYHSVDWLLAPQTKEGAPLQGESDFIIAHPDDGLLVLEVKGGVLTYDPASTRWTQTGRSGRHYLDEDPFHQARDEMKSLISILENQHGWDRWRPTYGYGVALPDGLYDRDAHPAARAAWVIDRDDLDRLEERVRQIMDAWRHGGRTFGSEGMEALQNALGVRLEIRTPLKFPFDEEDSRIVELTEDQTYVLAYITKRRRAAVVGPAGSGKTMLAIQVAKKLAAGGNRTLLACFNRRLAEHLRSQIGSVPKLDVYDFHGLCRQVATEAGLSVPPEPSQDATKKRHEEETLPGLLGEGADLLGPRYDAIVVDEAQDFRPGWWPSLMKLHLRPEDGYLFIFADNNQNLYSGGVPEDMVDLALPLPVNVRSTKPIHEFVSVFYKEAEPAAGKGAGGRPVEVLSYRDQSDLNSLLGRVLKNLELEGVPLEDVVVLTPAGKTKSPLRQRGRADGYELAERPTPGKVLTGTIHGFKGLEREVVILAEIGEGHREDLGSYLYVGGSRARNHLIVLAAEPVARELRRLAGVGPG